METLHQDFENIAEDLGAIGVMGQDGDTKHVWRPTDKKEVAEAKLLFETLTAKGYRAYRMAKGGRSGKPIKTFDEVTCKLLFVPPGEEPAAKEPVVADPPHVLLVPPMQGG